MLRFVSRCLRGVALAATLSVSACGYLIFEERAGQPPGGQLDWGIVALDAVGLLFGVIPGIVAFAVDFSTGCIYLPPQSAGYGLAPAADAPASVPAGWVPALMVSPFAGDAEITQAVTHYLDVGELSGRMEAVEIHWQPTGSLPIRPPQRHL